MSHLSEKLEEANRREQHVFLWDKTGQVPCYFEGTVVDFTQQMVQVALAQKHDVNSILTKALNGLSSELIQAMATGSHFLINLGMLAPNFDTVYTDDKIFPAETIFDCKRWRLTRVHSRFVARVTSSALTSVRSANSPS